MNSYIAKYLEELQKFEKTKYIFRGQSNAKWGIDSTYYRRFNLGKPQKDWGNPAFNQFKEYNTKLVKNAKSYRYHTDKKLNDIEMLQELQHFGAATGLVDFTYDFLTALWFATHPNDADGKIFLIDISNNTDFVQNSEIELQDIDNKIYFIDNKFKSNNRISAQNGLFLFTNETIQATQEITITKSHKKDIRTELKNNFNISEETLFQDVFGFAYVNDQNHPISQITAEEYFEKANALFRNGKYEQAIADYDKAIEINSGYGKAYNNRGFAYGELDQNDKEIADYSKAIEINSDDHDAHYNRGIVYDELEKYNNAIDDYSKAIKIKSNDSEVYYNRGNVYTKLEQYNNAIDDYSKAIEINPDNVTSYNNLFELTLIQHGIFPNKYEQLFVQNFSNDKQAMMEYTMLKILQLIYTQQPYDIEKWQQDYNELSLNDWSFDEIDKWIGSLDESQQEIQEKLLHAQKIFKQFAK